jgi:hypothetical protein
MGDNNIPVFDSRNKTEMLREIFFGGKHIKHDSFDKDFCEKINEEYATINEKLAEDENDIFPSAFPSCSYYQTLGCCYLP